MAIAAKSASGLAWMPFAVVNVIGAAINPVRINNWPMPALVAWIHRTCGMRDANPPPRSPSSSPLSRKNVLFRGVILRGFLSWLLQPPTIKISLALYTRPGKEIDDELPSAPEVPSSRAPLGGSSKLPSRNRDDIRSLHRESHCGGGPPDASSVDGTDCRPHLSRCGSRDRANLRSAVSNDRRVLGNGRIHDGSADQGVRAEDWHQGRVACPSCCRDHVRQGAVGSLSTQGRHLHRWIG